MICSYSNIFSEISDFEYFFPRETLAAAQRSTGKGLTPALGEASIRRTWALARTTAGVPHTTVPMGNHREVKG